MGPGQSAAFDVAGPAGALPIVLIHGAAWTRAQWLPQTQALAETFRVIALDLPAHGVCAGEPFRLAAAAEAVAEAIAQGAGGTQALVVGHSLGGYVAIMHAAAHREQVAGLLLAGSCVDYRLLGLVSALDAMMSLRLVGERRIVAMQQKSMREMLAPDLAEAEIAAGFTFGALPAVYRELARHDFRALLRTIARPTLILNGERDRPNRRAEQRTLAACQQGQLAMIADSGHLCNLERPDAFTAQTRAMAERLTPR
ncbi:MAG TPA: alpha/beta hydrolase [Ktedonobacterales bacterium]|jgi:pimeloyl-ACP methyl ester carboxylesterase|nr:alpha/beta hydrolase [Ktedonobacterales bacterium]